MPADLSLVHLTRPPRDPATSNPPLMLLLHGRGSNEQDLFSFANSLDPRFFVVSPRAPLVLDRDAYAWYHMDFTAQGPRVSSEQAEAGRAALIRFVREAVAAFGTDPARTYLLGFSQGAIMSLSVALTNPELVAGVLALSGRLLPESRTPHAPESALQGLPIFVGHGIYDSVLPIENGREVKALLETLPVDLTYREYPADHQVTPEEFSDFTAWLGQRLGPA